MTRQVAKCTLDAIGAEEVRLEKGGYNGQRIVNYYIRKEYSNQLETGFLTTENHISKSLV